MLKPEEHRGKIRLYPLFVAGLGALLLLISNVFILKSFQKKESNEGISRCADGVKTMFHTELTTESKLLQNSLDFLLRDVTLQQAWLKKDRQVLLDYSLAIFKQVLSRQDITHFYFMDTDRVCFLRVHQPDRYGDSIDRFTMMEACQRGQTASGIELGPLGTFVLRVVTPWVIDGKIQGYMELGKEINPVAEHIKRSLNVELFLTINKGYLKRSDWKDGQAMLGRKGSWDQFPNYILVNETVEKLPDDVYSYIRGLKETKSEKHIDTLFDTSWSGRNYKGKSIALYDAGGRDVGDILVFSEIQSQQAVLYRLFNIFICAYGAMFILLLVLFNVYFKKIGHKLDTAYVNLAREPEGPQNTNSQIERQD